MKYKKILVSAVVLSVGILAVIISRLDLEQAGPVPKELVQTEAHDEHEDEQAIELSEDQINEIDIKLTTAGSGKLEIYVNLLGEVAVNSDRVAHIVPTVPGVVRQVDKDIGDNVVAGEVIAWLESTKLGGAKVDYLARQSEVSCCSIELTRAQEVYDNTMKLLETLKSSPSLETLLNMNGTAMGMNRNLLVSSYAEFTFARETYLREKDLYEKKVSSKGDFLKAESAFKKADAQYAATRDSVNYEVYRNLLEARRVQNTREIELKAAEQLLYVLGLSAEEVNDLAVLSKNQGAQAKEEEECNDPNCAECAAKGRDSDFSGLRITNEKLGWYPIRSPFEGTIIDKHITLGEVVKDDSEVFVVADLNTVWVDLHVYQKDLMTIQKGQKVVISAGPTMPDTESVINYVGPVVGKDSRTALARIVVSNKSGMFRPGMYVTAKVLVADVEADIVLPKEAVQTLNGEKCVFIKDAHGFESVIVTIGRSDADYVEVTSGLKAGRQYVTKGAFELKARLITSTLGNHAGHGH